MAENKEDAVDVDLSKATPVEPAEPTEVHAIMGATFAERAAAAQGKQVDAESDVEDKAVTKKRASAKKKS